MNEIERKHHFDQMDEAEITWINGSTPPAINCHNRHSKAIMSVTKQRRFISRLRVGPAAPPNHHTGQN
jgi:hypothetical protein